MPLLAFIAIHCVFLTLVKESVFYVLDQYSKFYSLFNKVHLEFVQRLNFSWFLLWFSDFFLFNFWRTGQRRVGHLGCNNKSSMEQVNLTLYLKWNFKMIFSDTNYWAWKSVTYRRKIFSMISWLAGKEN